MHEFFLVNNSIAFSTSKIKAWDIDAYVSVGDNFSLI